jgi:PAS domain S-box-containing protein
MPGNTCDKLDSVNIRTRLELAVGLVLAVNLVAAWYAVLTYKQTTAQETQVRELCSQIVAMSLTAQVHFKKQVQEWKDVLLRGYEPKLYRKYLDQFIDEESKTRNTIRELIPMLDQNPDAQHTTKEFLIAHERLGVAYREALQHFHTTKENPHIAVDLRVRGIDRGPTDLIDRVVASMAEYKNKQLAAIETMVGRVETRVLVVVIGVMMATLAMLLWLIDRSIARPIAAATRIAQRISAGDLAGPIDAVGSNEAARLLQALKTMQHSLMRYQETLRESEERTRLLLDSTGEGIYGVDLEGRCMFINPAGLEMLGYSAASQVLGTDIHQLIHHTRPDGTAYPIEACRALQTYRNGRSSHVDDEMFWRSNGKGFPVEYRSYPIRHDGWLIGAVVTFTDITERKRTEAALREAHAELAKEKAMLADRVKERTAELRRTNEELAHTAQAKDEFLAAMSHELRTPLTTIIGISETLADHLYGPLDDKQVKAVNTIQESANHLLELINDVLEVAKAGAGKMKMVFDIVPVEQLCEASLRLVLPATRRRRLQVSSKIDPQVLAVHADGRRLKQLLVNLLDNAAKFAPEGGSIGLEVTGDAAQKRVRFTVWDTGIGIAEDRLDKLFKPFVQLDSALSRQYRGTGLGLALVHRMAGLLGGRVSVQSRPGEGSRFHVDLPWEPGTRQLQVHDNEDTQAAAQSPEDAHDGKATILLAEDNKDIVTMLADYLESVGYRVVVAGDGVQAVAKAMEERPDIILMDIQMPNMDGLEATRRLRSDAAFRKTPIIALTALAMSGDRATCLEAGADDYLSKPVGLKTLHRTIQSWLQRRLIESRGQYTYSPTPD